MATLDSKPPVAKFLQPPVGSSPPLSPPSEQHGLWREFLSEICGADPRMVETVVKTCEFVIPVAVFTIKTWYIRWGIVKYLYSGMLPSPAHVELAFQNCKP